MQKGRLYAGFVAAVVAVTMVSGSLRAQPLATDVGTPLKVAGARTIVQLSQPSSPPSTLVATPQAVTVPMNQTPQDGIPAIRPRAELLRVAGPALAAEDIAEYVSTYPIRHWDRSGPKPTIEKVEFLTSKEVAERMRIDRITPADRLICVVTLRGSFVVFGPVGSTPSTTSTAVQVFDARTGNLLMNGL